MDDEILFDNGFLKEEVILHTLLTLKRKLSSFSHTEDSELCCYQLLQQDDLTCLESPLSPGVLKEKQKAFALIFVIFHKS